MDSLEAKQILLLYRDGIDRLDDPEFAEALTLARHDRELGAWLDLQRDLQGKLRSGFRGIAIPEGLKEQIVSERRVRLTLVKKRKVLLVASTLAIFAILAAILINLPKPPGEDKNFTGFSKRMTSIVVRSYPKMDLETDDLGKIHQYLAQQGRGDYVLPVPLSKTAGTGCKTLTWQSKPVAMVCFRSAASGKPKSPDLFLFVINQDSMPDYSSANSGAVTQLSKLALLSWTQNGKLYLLGALGAEAKRVQDSVAADVRKL